MKKTTLICLLSLFFISKTFCQTTSLEVLGNSLTQSLVTNNMEQFQSLLMSKATFLHMMEKHTPKSTSEEETTALLKDMETNFESYIQEPFETNFKLAQNKVANFDVSFQDATFKTLKNTPAITGPETKVIHVELNHDTMKHLYFVASKYQKRWYIAAPTIQITEKEGFF